MLKASRDETRAFIALRLGSIVLPALAAAIWGIIAWRGEMDSTRNHAEDSALLVAQYVERLVQTQSIVHAAVRVRADVLDDAALRSRGFHDFLRGIEAGNDGMLGIAVVGIDGTYVAASRIYPISGRMSRRAYLEAIAGGAGFFIDRIKLELKKEDAIVIATPLHRAAGGRRCWWCRRWTANSWAIS